MAVQYSCKQERRRAALVGHETLNGIDYLEVVDHDATDESLRQRTLLIRCVNDLPSEYSFTRANVRIEGGVRVTDIGVEWAMTGTALTAAQLAELPVTPDPNSLLVVRTDRTGDFSTYRLRLVASQESTAPPPGFDEVLSTVDFSFKVECPSEFDCAAAPVCPAETRTEPVIDYLAKDYASFRQLLFDRLAVIMPDWAERNPADLGVALVELLAYAGDRLSYFQDAAATEAYLGTARRRTSIRRHARLLDYRMHDGCNARAWVTFCVEDASDGAVLQARDEAGRSRVRLLTRVPDDTPIPEERLEEIEFAHAPEVFELMHDMVLYEAHNTMSFYLWADEECCLPKGATQATLCDACGEDGARLRLRPGDVLLFEEVVDPTTGQTADADRDHRHAVRLTRVSPEAAVDTTTGLRAAGELQTDPLTGTGIVRIEWAAEDALPFPLCLSAVVNGELKEISVTRGNVALVDHGSTIADEELSNLPDPSSRMRSRPVLQEIGLTYGVAYEHATATEQPAADAMTQEPRDAMPDIELTGDGDTWYPQPDLLDSDPFDSHFVVEAEDDGRSYLRFARPDDLAGKVPDADARFKARYRVGNGTAGNVGAEAIAHVVAADVSRLSGVTSVRNPLPAAGGVAPESSQKVRLDAPQAFRVQQRAVTEQDYAEVAQRHVEVQKAVATRRWTGSWHTMFLTVDRRAGRPVDAAFERELLTFLSRYRLAGHDLEVDAPAFVPLDIAMTVCVQPGYFAGDVEVALLEVFSNHDLADGRRGFFHADQWTFGQPVYVSRIIATSMEVPGVQWVDLEDAEGKGNRFRRWGEPSHGEFKDGLLKMERLEIAQLENDPNAPESGKIEFLMEGGL